MGSALLNQRFGTGSTRSMAFEARNRFGQRGGVLFLDLHEFRNPVKDFLGGLVDDLASAP